MKRRVLITGASGYIGTYVYRQLSRHEKYEITFLREDLRMPDLTAFEADVVIHLAGKLNSFNGEPEEILDVNYRGTVNLLRSCLSDAHVILLSSDQVFRSDPSRVYAEGDPVDPETVYGRSKALAEAYVRTEHRRSTILRASVVYGYRHPRRAHAVRFLESGLAACERVEAYRDVFSCPTYIGDLYRVIERAINEGIFGTFHACGQEYVSRYGIGELLCELGGYDRTLLVGVDKPHHVEIPRFLHLRASTVFQEELGTDLRSGLMHELNAW